MKAGAVAVAPVILSLFFVTTQGKKVLPGTVPVRGLLLVTTDVPHRRAIEVVVPASPADEAVLGRPLALAAGADRLYIADALDCSVKVFSKDGRFLTSFGRKGGGPGELSFPSGVCIVGEAIAVADKLNLRIQLFDAEGRVHSGFKLPFAPDRILALSSGRLLVTSNPTGRKPGERLLHIFDTAGRPVWEGLEAATSHDPVSDAFRNMILACNGESGDFYVIFRSGERAISCYSDSGALLGRIVVDERHAFRMAELAAPGGARRLAGFCWAGARDRGLFYLSAPEAMAGRDLGPGRTVSVVDGQGRLEAVVDLPCPVHRFVVSEGRLFAVDDEGDLRIFEVGR
jgi:hypothetical protein